MRMELIFEMIPFHCSRGGHCLDCLSRRMPRPKPETGTSWSECKSQTGLDSLFDFEASVLNAAKLSIFEGEAASRLN